MKLIIFISIILLSFVSTVFAYPEQQLNDCIESAKNNPTTKEISDDSIFNYCDCALIAIIDENKDIRESGYECALKNFN